MLELMQSDIVVKVSPNIYEMIEYLPFFHIISMELNLIISLSFLLGYLLSQNVVIAETVYMRAESQNNPSDGNTNPIDCTRIGTGTTNQLPTRTSLAEISSYTPSFHPPQHFYPGNPLQPSAATWNCPPRNHVPQPVSSFEFQSNGLSSSLPPNLLEGTKGGDI